MALQGKTVVFTGTLNMKRNEATAMAVNAGAKVTGAVSKNTNIVVAGAASGSKLDDAKAKGVEVWTEEQFIAAAKGGAPKAPTGATSKKVPKKAAAKEPAPKPAKKAAKKAKADDDDEADEDDDEDAPPKKAAKTAANATPATSAAPAAAAAGGARPVDRTIPNATNYQIFEDWSIKLNQTNIDGNNNKFYIIQLLTSKDGSNYFTWNRWGRVGEVGQSKLEPCGSLQAAKAQFESKFRDKTKNPWSAVKNNSFVSHDGKYTLVETEEKDDAAGGAEHSPMGKLSKAQIEKGQRVLEDISQAVAGNRPKAELNKLSSTFFTLIPTDFGRRRPEPITDLDTVHKKEELLKFYLRMGFEEVESGATTLAPIHGVMELPVPSTLKEAIGGCCSVADVAKSVSQGKQLADKQAGKPVRKMSAEQYGSIMLYTSNAIYAQLNQALRSEKRAAVEKYFRYLRLLFDATECLPKKEVQLYRGIGVDLSQQYKVGSTITWWGVSSTTSDPEVARNFANSCGGGSSLLTIDTSTSVDISSITFYSNEKESLLMPGTQLLVQSVTKKGSVAEIHLKEVGRVVS